MSGITPRMYPVQILALAFSATLAAAQQPPAGVTGGMAKIPTVELTEESAENAIDVYLTLREKYGDKVPPANQLRGMAEAAEMNAVVTDKGFKDTQDWQKAITSVVLAQGFLKKGSDAGDMDEKIAELEANLQIPAAYKEQMLGMLKSTRPSENNLTVVKGLLADPAYAKKIAEITK